MAEKINVLIVEPGKAPQPSEVEATQEAFAGIVGGEIETGVYLPQRVMVVRNAAPENLPPNRMIPGDKDCIAGTFLLCGFEDDSFISLTPEQRMDFQRILALPDFSLFGKGERSEPSK